MLTWVNTPHMTGQMSLFSLEWKWLTYKSPKEMEILSFIVTVIMGENYHTKKIVIIENSKRKIKLVHVNK